MFGYDDKVKIFRKLIEEDNLSHAYLFYGEPQVGKFTFALSLASFLEKGDFSPHGPLFDAAVISGEIGETVGIEDVLKMQQFLFQRPMISKRRTLIIDNAMTLTREAQGALLKIVEEPPQSSLIIFISSDEHYLFETLLSRVEKVFFQTLNHRLIRDEIANRYGITGEEAEKIASLSFGRFGRAVCIAEKRQFEREDNLESILSSNIVELYRHGVIKNQKVLSWLLRREVAVKKYRRYNLNMRLQQRAIEAFLSGKVGKMLK